jgi:hypothetical protein
MKSKLLPLFLLLFLSQSAFGSRPIGADITYRYLGSNKYYVEMSVLRDCRGIALNSITFGWYAGKGGNTSCGTGTLSNFKRVKITDISLVHSTRNMPCNPPNSAGGEGIELHTYTDTLDISKSPFAAVINNSACTELSLYVSKCCRSGAINTGSANQDFFATATLYIRNIAKCPKQSNTSPYFQRTYPGFNCCNMPTYWSLGAVDSIDRDSLSFQLAAGIQSLPNSSISYSTPFTYQYPLTPYCPPTAGKVDCTPNINTDPPRGFFLNTKTGDLVYTPTKCDQTGVVAIEISEYRRDSAGNMLLIAKNRRDAQVITKDDCGYNKTPKISGNFDLNVAAGGTICQTFTIEDALFTPQQTSGDTILVDWAGSSNEPSWKFTRDSLNSNKGQLEFCWKTKPAVYSEFPYTFTIRVNDNHYPKPSVSMRTFSVLIQPLDTASIASQTNLICAGAKLSASLKRGDKSKASFSWVLRDSATQKTITTSSLSEFNVKYLKKGVYEVQLNVSHPKYAYATVRSYFNMSANVPQVSLGADKSVCKGSSSSISSSNTAMGGKIGYQWYVNNTLQADTISTINFANIDTNTIIRVVATDSLGCMARDTATIMSLQLPVVVWDNAVSSLCWSPSALHLNAFIKSPNPSGFTASNVKIRGSLSKYGPAGLVDTSQAPDYFLNIGKINNALDLQSGKTVKETITLWYKDSNSCENTANTAVTINGLPIIELTSKTLCQNAALPFYLDSLIIRPKVTFGTIREWSLLNGPKTSGILGKDINDKDIFTPGTSPDNSYSGNYDLQFCVTDQLTGCQSCDTTLIQVLPQFAVEALNFTPVCEGSGKIALDAYFLANGNKSVPANSTYTIISRNGNTDSKTWANASLTSGYIMPTTMPAGKWVISFSPKTNGTYCAQAIEQTFEIYPSPNAAFTTTPTDSTGKDLPIFKTSNTSSIADNSTLSYQWYFNYPDLANNSASFAPDINYPASDATYTVWLIATSTNGCSDTAVKTLKVGSPINGIASISLEQFRITPQFVVSGIAFTEIETEVYDAAGKLLARSNNNTPIALPTGIYLYKLSLKFGDTADILHLSGKVFVE